jgi:signal transduction histidine kinase/CheY-like chemotaxis protein
MPARTEPLGSAPPLAGTPEEGTLIVLADGRVGLCSVAAERILGVTFDRLLVPGACQVVGEDGQPLPGQSAFASGSREAILCIERADRADGSPLWLKTRARPLGPTGRQPLAQVVTFHEVRRDPTGTFRPVTRSAELAQELVWELEVGQGRLSFEPPVSQVGLIEPAGVGGVWFVVAPEDREALSRAWKAHAEGQTAQAEVECRARTTEGGWRWVLLRARVILREPDGALAWVVGTVSDISQKKALEAQLSATERLASIGTLAAGVAHEINNPLAWISANLGFVLEHIGEGEVEIDELRRALREALDGVSRVADIVRRLRVFGRPGTPAGAARSRVGVAEELAVALALSRHDISHRARLVVDLPPRLPDVMMVPHDLAQVAVNLLRNASQSIPEGKAHANEVRVTARAVGEELVLEIKDTGVGIPPSVRPRIFDPFFTTRPQGEGTGLGLSVCHGIVSAAKGRIEVESAPGQGSTFRVVLPTVMVERPALGPPAPRGARRRVLVVDDEPMMGRAVARLLGDAHEVSAVTSAAQALALLEGGERYHLVLCDLMMPDTTGMDFARLLAAASPQMAARLVFMTGGAFTPAAEQFLESRPLPAMLKPLDAKALLERIGSMPELD